MRVNLILLGIAAAMPVFTQDLRCIAQAAGTPSIRAEGAAELTGDIILSCGGGTPTPAGRIVPQMDLRLASTSEATITSRVIAGDFSEAMMFVDEPVPVNQRPCGAAASFPYSVQNGSGQPVTDGVCGAVAGTGTGVGVYDPLVSPPSVASAPNYRGNAFQGRRASERELVLTTPTAVQISMQSTVFDAYLFLIQGPSANGAVIAGDDDSGAGTNSRIARNLPAGNYLVEATSYGSGSLGSFTVSVNR